MMLRVANGFIVQTFAETDGVAALAAVSAAPLVCTRSRATVSKR